MNNQEPLNPAEQNNMNGGVMYNQAPEQPQGFQQPQATETLEAPQQYDPNGYAYQPAPSQPVYNGYPYTAPATPIVKKKAVKGNAVVMLLMTFITFACMVVLPWLSFKQVANAPVHITDVLKVSTIGLNIKTIHEGDLVNYVDNEFENYLSGIESQAEKIMMKQFKGPTLDFVSQSEGNIISVISTIRFFSKVAMITMVVLGAFWIVLLIAAANGMKKLYSILNVILLLLLGGVTIAIGFALSFESIGVGLLLTIVMLIASVIVGCVSKVKEVTSA